MSWDGAFFPSGFGGRPKPAKKSARATLFNARVLAEFLPYQREWIKDRSRFKIGLWARQTGKDMAAAAEAVIDCMEKPGTVWAGVAAGGGGGPGMVWEEEKGGGGRRFA